ncbi:MAG: DUF6488 family protein [Campylobacterota bacterium]
MNKLIKATVITMALSLTALYAGDEYNHDHSGHNHGSHGHSHETLHKSVSNTTVKKTAIKEVKRLALEKRIPKSWKSVPVAKIGKAHHGNTNDWVVGFENPKIKDKTKQTLYIFVSIHGQITGANYTGN